MGKSALDRIRSIATHLKSRRKIPKNYHADLEVRCVILWGKPQSAQGTASARQIASRERQARRTYSEIQEENCLVFLPFMLAISPRACKGFTQLQKVIEEYSTFRLDLGNETRGLLNGIAVKNKFDENPAYIAFIKSLFPTDVLEHSLRHHIGNVDNFELIQGIIKQRGLSENPTCIEFLNLMFPEEYSARQSIMEQEHMTAPKSSMATRLERRIEYRCSAVPISLIPFVGPPIYDAIRMSKQWKWERETGGRPTTDCMNALVPDSAYEDITFTFTLGHQVGLRLIDEFKMMVIW